MAFDGWVKVGGVFPGNWNGSRLTQVGKGAQAEWKHKRTEPLFTFKTIRAKIGRLAPGPRSLLLCVLNLAGSFLDQFSFFLSYWPSLRPSHNRIQFRIGSFLQEH